MRRLLGSQNQTITRKEEQSVNQIELLNNIRQILSRYTMDLEKNLRLKYDELNKPVTGEISKLLQSLTNQLTDFERVDVAEKSEKVEIRISSDYEHLFLSSVKEKLSEHLNKDAAFVKVATDEVVNRINQLLSSRDMLPVSLQSELLEFPAYRSSMKPYLLFSREFRSELMKKGITEYFVALRDYTGVIMVATGLLAPLTIIANISEIGFLKHLNNVVS